MTFEGLSSLTDLVNAGWQNMTVERGRTGRVVSIWFRGDDEWVMDISYSPEVQKSLSCTFWRNVN